MAVFWYGFCGGMAVNLLRLTEIGQLRKVDRPQTFSDWMYCVQFVFLPLLGGFIAHAYNGSGSPLTPNLGNKCWSVCSRNPEDYGRGDSWQTFSR